MLAARTKALVAVIEAALKINGDPIPLVLIDWKGDPETEHWTERLGGADGESRSHEHGVGEAAGDRVGMPV